MEKLMTVAGKRVIVNVQHSKIGGSYPRLFVEVNEEQYINFDLTLGAAFKMKKSDFMDWLEDAVEVITPDIPSVCESVGLNYPIFVEFMRDLK